MFRNPEVQTSSIENPPRFARPRPAWRLCLPLALLSLGAQVNGGSPSADPDTWPTSSTSIGTSESLIIVPAATPVATTQATTSELGATQPTSPGQSASGDTQLKEVVVTADLDRSRDLIAPALVLASSLWARLRSRTCPAARMRLFETYCSGAGSR